MMYARMLVIRWLKGISVVALALSMTRCSPLPAPVPHLDLSDETHMLASLEQMEAALPEERRPLFERSFQQLVTSLTLRDMNRWAGAPTAMPELSFHHLDGLTAEDIIEKAASEAH